MMERVAIYARVSTEEQAERHTVENQLTECRRWCEARGWAVTQEYTDAGVSGTVPLDERPAGGRLLAALADRAFDRVVIYAVDRLSRASMDVAAADYNRLFSATRSRDGDERLHFVALDLPASTPEGELTVGMLQLIARYERRSIVRRTTQGRRRKAREGSYVASITPYGYAYDPAAKTLREHPEQADVVREVFRLATEENLGLHAVAARLNEAGVPPPANASHPCHRSTHGWHASMVNRLLTSPRYVGRGTYAGEPMACPPLVSEGLFAAAAEARQRRKTFSPRNTKHVYLLQHLARCGVCGASCVAARGGRERLAYYVCCQATRYGARAHGGRSRWPAQLVEPPVQRYVLALLNDPDAALAQAQVYWERQDAERQEREERRQQLEGRVARAEEEEAKVVTWARKGYITEAVMLRQVNEARAEHAAALDELNALPVEDVQAAAREAVDRAVVLGSINLMRRPEWQQRHRVVNWATLAVQRLKDAALAASSVTQEDRARWQQTIRGLVTRVTLGADGDVTVEGTLPLDVAVASPPS